MSGLQSETLFFFIDLKKERKEKKKKKEKKIFAILIHTA